jgi:bifunctional enzyme CysN/CysC
MSLASRSDAEIIRISTAGSVDDGKSTLLGRLLVDTDSIYEDHFENLKRTSEYRGEEVNLALLADGLKAEREQGITIDVAYRYFSTAKKRFIVADTPGHTQYTRNMITGASTADASIILIDARHGMTEQSKRHAFITSLLRVPQVLVVVNKMDLVDYSQAVFQEIEAAFREYSQRLALSNITFIPVSALLGENVVRRSELISWYKGPAVLERLEELTPEGKRTPPDLRLPVQYVVRPDQNFRGYMGRIESGTLRRGEELLALPSGQTVTIKQLFELDEEVAEAGAGSNVLVTFDREVDVTRGDMLVRPRNLPAVTQSLEAVVCWMSEEPSVTGKGYLIRHTTREVTATLDEVVYRFDVETLHRNAAHFLQMNDIGRLVLSTGRPVLVDTYEHNRALGGFLLVDPVSNNVVAAGMVTRVRGPEPSSAAQRAGQVIWLTGLSGAGKSTISDALTALLRREGLSAAQLDGDDLRTGLNSDLGFSDADRSENLRRAAHVAKLFASLGNITICSFISPLNADRRRIREIVGERYMEVYVRTSLAECERRDPKGLYKRARAGEIKQFTGITSAFEVPDNPDLVLDTEGATVDQVVRNLAEVIRDRLR